MEEPGLTGITQRRTWEHHYNDIIRVILEALSILRNSDDLITDEVDLTRKLFFCFKRATHKLHLHYHLPVPEGNNPPYEDDKKGVARENKRPDFYWHFSDDSVDDPKLSDRRFVLECKRLGTPRPTSPDWILNQNYVQRGIHRFLTEEYAYAKGNESAAMIGFVESMEFDVILHEINTEIAVHTFPIPALSLSKQGWQPDGVSSLEHTLVRTFPISPFQLLHFWLDIRNCNLHTPESKRTTKSTKQLGKKGSGEKSKQKGEKVSNTKASRKQKQKVSSKEASQLELPVDQPL